MAIMKKTLDEYEAQLCFYSTIWRVAEAGRYSTIKRILVSKDIFDQLEWIELDTRLTELIVMSEQLPPLTCFAQTQESVWTRNN